MKKVHFIGIGGIGMSGLAKILLSQKIEVSGSDIVESQTTRHLKESGASLFIGHSESHISSDSTVVFSSDIKESNPEYKAALQLKCPLLHRSDLLALLMHQKKALAVTGTHGKTTTSSLLSWVLYHAKCDPSFVVGGILSQLDTNAKNGLGEYFVAEADESDGSFLRYKPHGAIVTNIGLDHMNHYLTEENLISAFRNFVEQVQSEKHLFWCGDDKRLRGLNLKGTSYGFSPHCDMRILQYAQKEWKTVFDIEFKGQVYQKIEIAQIGPYNVLNCTAVFGLALSLGIEEEAIRQALSSFPGVGRRCTHRGEAQGILFIDDYAHHPSEIEATLKAVREAIGERRLIVIFQPHRYTRTKDCLGTYEGRFDSADRVYITDIYSAGEAEIPGISYANIYQELTQGSFLDCVYTPRLGLANSIAKDLMPHDVVITLGAGDIQAAIPEMIETIKKAPPKIRVGVIYGGKSAEHEVSHYSAKHIFNSLNHDYYDVEKILITKEGKWEISSPATGDLMLSPEVFTLLQNQHIFFPILHGPFGEDGTIQGFFETIGKPYVGCDHQSAAISMDKAVSKKIMQREGILTSPFITFNEREWQTSQPAICEKILAELSFPVMVKPVHLGSSLGIKKICRIEELHEAAKQAFVFDTDIIVENFIEGREIEFAVIGNEKVYAFPPGEILTNGEIYDYEGKYSTEKAMQTAAQAVLPTEWIDLGRSLAIKAYRSATCKGMARVDFFLDRSGTFWFNEINPIPGFTPFSLYPQICEKNGLPGPLLMDKLIILGLQRARQKEMKNRKGSKP